MATTTTIIKDIKNDEMEAVIKELKEYKILKKQIEAKLEEVETTIKNYMKEIGEDNIAIGQYTCKLAEVTKSTFNKELVKEVNPTLYEKATGTSTYTRLTVK